MAQHNLVKRGPNPEPRNTNADSNIPAVPDDIAEFIQTRTLIGYSDTQIIKSLVSRFNIQHRTASIHLRDYRLSLAAIPGPAYRKMAHAAYVENLHAHKVALMKHTITIQEEYDRIMEARARREELEAARAQTTDPDELDRIIYELHSLPFTDPYAVIQVVVQQMRARESIIKLEQQIAKVKGADIPFGDWQAAVSLLLDEGLLPSKVAAGIEKIIDRYERPVNEILADLDELFPESPSQLPADDEDEGVIEAFEIPKAETTLD